MEEAFAKEEKRKSLLGQVTPSKALAQPHRAEDTLEKLSPPKPFEHSGKPLAAQKNLEKQSNFERYVPDKGIIAPNLLYATENLRTEQRKQKQA